MTQLNNNTLIIQIAAQTADILHYEGRVSKNTAMQIMDALTEGLQGTPRYQLLDLLNEVSLALGVSSNRDEGPEPQKNNS